MSSSDDPGIHHKPVSLSITPSTPTRYDVIVLGSLVADISCHYTPLDSSTSSQTTPTTGSSNVARISQCVGGVAHNIALGLHHLGVKALLMSVVAEDAAGSLLLNTIEESGLSTEGILPLPASAEARTSVYVGNYDASKSLIFGMADVSLMNQLQDSPRVDPWLSLITTHKPKCLILDLCPPPKILTSILAITQHHNIPLIIEPVSAPRATQFMNTTQLISQSTLFPHSPYHLITPNDTELSALHSAFISSPLHSLLNSSRRYARIQEAINQATSQLNASPWPADFKSVATQALALLPVFPSIAVTFGVHGCFYCCLAYEDAPLVSGTPDTPTVKLTGDAASIETGDSGSRTGSKRKCVVRVEHYPPPRRLKDEDVVNVDGAGDSFVAGWVAAMLRHPSSPWSEQQKKSGEEGGRGRRGSDFAVAASPTSPGVGKEDAKHLASTAQRAALMTLRDPNAVSGKLRSLKISGGTSSAGGVGGGRKSEAGDGTTGSPLRVEKTEETNASLASVNKELANLVSKEEEESGTTQKENEALGGVTSEKEMPGHAATVKEGS